MLAKTYKWKPWISSWAWIWSSQWSVYWDQTYALCMFWVTKLFLGRCNMTHLLTPDREPMANQGTGITKFQHGEPVSFVGVTYVSVGEGLLTGVKMAHRQLYHTSPAQHWQQLTQSGRRRLMRLESVFSKPLCSKLPLPGSSACVCFFQANWPGLRVFSAAQLCPVWEGLSGFVAYLGREGPSQYGEVPGPSWCYAELFTFLLKELPYRMDCFSLGGNGYMMICM